MRSIGEDEIFQEGYIGLVRAEQIRYDIHARDFPAYASRSIRKHINRFVSGLQDGRCITCDTETLEYLSFNHSKEHKQSTEKSIIDAVVDAEAGDAIRKLIGGMDERTQDIILSRYGIGRKKETLQTLSMRHRVSTTRIWQIEKNALKKMRRNHSIMHFK